MTGRPARWAGMLLLLAALACAGPAPDPGTAAPATGVLSTPPQSPAAPIASLPPPSTAPIIPVPGDGTSLPDPGRTPAATPTPWPPDTGWEWLPAGLERRWLTLSDDQGRLRERIFLVRLDPADFVFAVGYRPGEPVLLSQWLADSGALVAVNAGYFTEGHTATGLVVSGGRPSGQSYGAFAGMLAVTESGPELRWLQEKPYDPAEPLWEAFQSFPILIRPGGEPGYREPGGERARRTAVGRDGQGRFVFLAAGVGHFTLVGWSQFLAAGDLGLELALNLDGGLSTGLLLAAPEDGLPAFVPLPTVLLISPARPP